MNDDTPNDAIVVGGGLFGQIIAAGLRAQGRRVDVLDSREPEAGSGPAACLMKPSWFSSLGKEVYEPSLRLLDELYDVHDITFVTRPKLKKATVHWCDPEKILTPHTVHTEVLEILEGPPNMVVTAGGVYSAELIVVAAGVWTQKLLPQYVQQGQKGVAYLWPHSRIATPFVKPWAPYRQLVAFNRGDGLWVGDGTAIKTENWTRGREEACWQRAAGVVGRLGHGDRERGYAKTLSGIRPYAKGHKPCLLERVYPGLWVASGGAKNGTLAAGYCAHVIRSSTP